MLYIEVYTDKLLTFVHAVAAAKTNERPRLSAKTEAHLAQNVYCASGRVCLASFERREFVYFRPFLDA